jgi:hypothetical protein
MEPISPEMAAKTDRTHAVTKNVTTPSKGPTRHLRRNAA